MQPDNDDYLKKRAQELGLGREDVLAQVQAWLDERYPGQAKAASLNKGVLLIITSSASVASELRLGQMGIIALDLSVERLSIRQA